MKDLILKFLFKADSSDVKKEIRVVETQGKKAAEGIGSSLKNAFIGLGSAIAGLGLSRIFKGAIDDAAALEQALLKLRAAAKNTGQDFGAIQKGLQRLRSEGTLSFQTITEASQQLLQQGFQADDIEPFLRALRNIGALENTVGNTNEAMKSFIRAISTNSIELVDNLSPALRKTVLELGGFNEIAKNADKQQQFINITLERGAQFAGAYNESIKTLAGQEAQLRVETEKLSEAYGRALSPAFESTLQSLSPLVIEMTNFINSLGPAGKSLVAAASAVALFGSALGGLAGTLKLLGVSLAFLNPYVAIFSALAVGAATFAVSLNAATKEQEKLNQKEGEFLKLLKKREQGILSRPEQQRFKQLKESLKINKDILNVLEQQKDNIEEQAKTIKKRNALTAVQTMQGARSAGRRATQAVSGLPMEELLALQRLLKQAEGSTSRQVEFSGQFRRMMGVSGPAVINRREVQVEVDKAIKAQKELDKALKKTNKRIDDTKDSLEFAVTPLDRYRSALEDIDNQVKDSAKTAETANAARLAKEAALTDAIDETTGDIENMTDAVETLKDESASAADKLSALGTGLKGFGQTLGTLLDDSGIASKFGVAGAAVGLVGGIAGLIGSIFDSQEQEIDPDRIPTILEREREILEKQLDVQRRTLDFQKAQSDAQKKYFEDQIDLARIEAERAGEDPGPKIKELITGELTRLGFEGDETTEQLRAQIDETARLREEKIRAESRLADLQAGTLSLEGSMAIANMYGQNESVRSAIRDFEQGFISQIAMQQRITNAAIFGASQVANSADLEEQERIQDLLEQSLMIASPPAPAPAAAPQLAQAQGRGFGLIDISRGGLQTATGFSVTRGASLAAQAGVPGSIGSLTVATEAMKTTEDKMLDTLNNQLSELKKQTDLLASMTGQDVTMAVLNAMADAETRTI